MNTSADIDQHAALQPTRDLARWCAIMSADDIPPAAYTWAKHCLLDWVGVTLAGADEPLVDMLVEEIGGSDTAPCTVIGRGAKASLFDAALINGSASHALDYDDVNWLMHGHPTVPVATVVLALGEMLEAPGKDVLAAFVIGYEVECRLGAMVGGQHYANGYHATGTLGTFGAAAAASWLMKLDVGQTRHALGMAAAQAAGLKSMFGTMTKPFHVGKAAMNGLMAARLAARGFTANPEAIECAQGFAVTQAPGFVAQAMRPDPDSPFAVEGNLFKYHAACYLTHSTIDAVRALKDRHRFAFDDVASIAIHVAEGHRRVCDIEVPSTGLEVKFSIRHLAALAADGADTADLALYSDEVAADPRIKALREKTSVIPADFDDDMLARVAITLKDGLVLEGEANAGVAAGDVAWQEERLTAKFQSLMAPKIGRQQAGAIQAAVLAIDRAASPRPLIDLCG